MAIERYTQSHHTLIKKSLSLKTMRELHERMMASLYITCYVKRSFIGSRVEFLGFDEAKQGEINWGNLTLTISFGKSMIADPFLLNTLHYNKLDTDQYKAIIDRLFKMIYDLKWYRPDDIKPWEKFKS